MTTPQTTFLLAIHDLEEARTLRYKPSGLLQYFCNVSVNDSNLISCLDNIAQKVSIHKRVAKPNWTSGLFHFPKGDE